MIQSFFLPLFGVYCLAMDIKFLVLYSVILLINIIVNAHFYFNSRKKIEYLWTMLFWGCFFINFLFQGAFNDKHQLLGISVVMVGISYFFSLKLFGSLFKAKVDSEFYIQVGGILTALGVVLSSIAPFQVFTIPLVIACVFPYLHFGYTNWNKIKETPLFLRSGFFFFCLSLVHILDYPFLRLDPRAAEIGFFIAFMTTILFSLVVHFISDSIYIKAIEDELTKTIEDKNELSRNLMAIDLVKSFSHEINNSLQNIESSNELIRLTSQNRNDQKTVNLTNNIETGLERIFTMFNLFNDSKRDESLKVEKLDEMFKEVVSLVEAQFKSSKTLLKIQKVPEVNLISSKGIFSQVLVNILLQFVNVNNPEVWVTFDDSTNCLMINCPNFKENMINLDLAKILGSQIKLELDAIESVGIIIKYTPDLGSLQKTS